MLTLSDVFKAQSKFGINTSESNTEYVSYELYLSGCRRALNDTTPSEYYNWDKKKQNNYTDKLIMNYVNENLKDVEGFVDENGDVDQEALLQRLRTDIIDFGILRKALEDDEVQEIQINDFKTIWVIKHGKAYLYTDKNGKPYQFVSDLELHSVVDRMIYNPSGNVPRMTVTNPLLNTRTGNKGYRLSAVNSSAITPDMKPGFDFPVTSVTLRKYAPSMLTFEDFEANDTLTPECSRFLRLCGRANIRLACVGPTSSGKTTLLNAIAWEIPRDNRIILIQNPTEIMLYERSEETGANLRNVLHWEASEAPLSLKDDQTTGTMANFIAHALRNTPDVIIPGEIRTPDEFFQADRALKTGHRVLTTFHAYDGKDAISRWATEQSALGGSIEDYVRSLANSMDIIVSQRKLDDGNRHVMLIEELTGRICDDGRVETKVLFRFKLTGEVDRDSLNPDKITKIHGYFEQCNGISEDLVQKFYAAGITREELQEFIEPKPMIKGKSNLDSQKLKTEVSNKIKDVKESVQEAALDIDEDLSFLGTNSKEKGVDISNDLSFLNS